MNIHCQQALDLRRRTYVSTYVRQIAAETEPVPFLQQPPCVDVRCVNSTLHLIMHRTIGLTGCIVPLTLTLTPILVR